MGTETGAMRHDIPGVLLINLGTPDAPTAPALRRYLAEFLADPDVVTLPRLLWLPLLYLVVLRTRPARSAEAYARIWTEQGSPLLVNSRALEAKLRVALQTGYGSPLLVNSRALEAKLRVALQTGHGSPVAMALGMRYGNPSIASALAALRDSGVTRLLVLPLYPQYSAATTASSLRAVGRALKRMRWSPQLGTVHDYHDQPGYLSALAESVRAFWRKHGQAQKLLISFHGIPQQVSDAGDPYARQCHFTAAALARQLGLRDDRWQTCFQSRFGRARWLQPYTETVLRDCAAAGLRDVDVICPGFAADCLETLEEIALRYAEGFRAAGGGALRYIPALNDGDGHVRALADVVAEHLKVVD